MVQETNVETALPVADAPVATPAEEPTAAPDAGAPEGTVPPESGEPAEPLSFDEWYEEQAASNEALRTSFELKVADLKEAGRREAQAQLQPKLDRLDQTFRGYHQTAQQLAQGVGAINEKLVEWLGDAGYSEQGITILFERMRRAAPEVWQGLNDLSGRAGGFGTLRAVAGTLGAELGGEQGTKFTGKYMEEFSNAEGGIGTAADVLKEMMSDYEQARLEKATAPLRKRIAVLEAQLLKGQAASRGANGPDSAQKAVAGGRPEAELLSDPATPIHIIKEIRERQRASQ